LLLHQLEIFQFGGTRDEANITAFFHQSTNPPVVVEFLYIHARTFTQKATTATFAPLQENRVDIDRVI